MSSVAVFFSQGGAPFIIIAGWSESLRPSTFLYLHFFIHYTVEFTQQYNAIKNMKSSEPIQNRRKASWTTNIIYLFIYYLI